MAVEVKEGQSVKHNGVIYTAGQIIHDLAEDVKAELVKFGVVKDLEQIAEQVKADAHTVAEQVRQDIDSIGNQADSQVAQNASADVQAAIETLKAPGEPVSQSSQPSAEDIQKTADSVA